MKSYAFFASFSILALVAGCTASTSNDQNTTTPADDAADELRAASVLASSFEINGTVDNTPFNSLTMKADHTFTAQGGCRQDGPGAHCFAITAIKGTWKTTKSGPQLGDPGGAAQLEFTDSFNQVSTYFYSLTSDQLALSTTFNGAKSLFDRDISKLPKLKSYDICADKYDNSVGQCPEDLPCEYDGPSGKTERCLPPI